jgi:phosphatidylinositol glycan class C protein
VTCGIALAVLDCLLLLQLSYTLSGLLVVVLASIVFICPAMLMWLRPLKNEINGPWDIARPHL